MGEAMGDGTGRDRDDVRRLEGTLTSLNEKMEAISRRGDEPILTVQRGQSDLAQSVESMVNNMQMALEAQRQMIAALSAQQASVAGVLERMAKGMGGKVGGEGDSGWKLLAAVGLGAALAVSTMTWGKWGAGR